MLSLSSVLSRALSQPIISRPIVSRPIISRCALPLSRPLSSTSSLPAPLLDPALLLSRLSSLAPAISSSLRSDGYYTAKPILPPPVIQAMRAQSIALRNEGRFEASYSEAIGPDGAKRRFDKEGVFACEPDGGDYETAPDLLTYMSTVITELPPLLEGCGISGAAFNAKLAVTSPGGSVYPLHVDNPEGVAAGDTRKLTAIVYLNPDRGDGDGGELRLHMPGGATLDLPPEGGRLVLFWSDDVPHEVLPTAVGREGEEFDRYALTIWLPTDELERLHEPDSKWAGLRSSE
jgi:hypothetical protein